MTMDNRQLPPPVPTRSRISFGTKVVLLGLQCALLMIGALAIWILAYSRDERNKDVADQIVKEWGGEVTINGPLASEHPDSALVVRPSTFNCEAQVDTKSLHRNIFEAEVFNAHIAMSGTVNKDKLATNSDSIYIELNLPTDQLAKLSTLKICGKTVEWNRAAHHLYAEADISGMPDILEFSTSFDIHGAESIFISQVGEQSFITIEGEAQNPSFNGSSLPDERHLSGNQFSAQWETDIAPAEIHDTKSVGANFLVGVDRYQKVTRSLKYSFMIILLTYASVLFAEIIMKRYIPLFNYFLIGAALIIFYILLLSFSEHLKFGIAYLIAAAMTVLLITGYMWKMLGSRKVAIAIGSILVGMYVSCYILLTLSTYSLILGSLILFAALAAMMYGSLQLKR